LSFEESEENLKKWKKGMKTSAKILSIDKTKMKVRLGIREAKGIDPFMNYFGTRENNQVITATVNEVQKASLKVSPGNSKNLLITIKKNDLALSPADCRPEIFRRGDVVKVMITNLDFKQRRVNLSIRALMKAEEAKLIKKFGKDGSSSGKVLKDILGKVFSSKKDKKDKK